MTKTCTAQTSKKAPILLICKFADFEPRRVAGLSFFGLMSHMGYAEGGTGGENKIFWVLRTIETLKPEKMTKKNIKNDQNRQKKQFQEFSEHLVSAG